MAGHFLNQDSTENDQDTPAIVAEINVTPLVDIMLVLLIIFMVSATLMGEDSPKESGIHVDLPKGKTSQPAEREADLVIALTRDEQMIVAGEVLSLDQLSIKLKRIKEEHPRATVVIQADKEVKHGKVAEVLDLARSLGLEQLSIATEAKD